MEFKAHILTIGDELLKGSTLNTNACFLGKGLTDLGFRVTRQVSCRDDRDEISAEMGRAVAEADVCIMSGGLGPTPDDVTRDSIADFFKVPLVFSQSQYDQIMTFFKVRKRRVPAMVKREACFPANAKPLLNRHGIALGFYIQCGEKIIFVLPGVPSELEKMFRLLVTPIVKKHFKGLGKRPQLTAKITGLTEPEIMKKLGRGFFGETFDFGIYPSPCETAIRIHAGSKTQLTRLRKVISEKLSPLIFAWEEISLAEAVGRLLVKKKARVAVAESCTGGHLAAEWTRHSGASQHFAGGIIAYSNQVKTTTLGVDPGVIKKQGAVSTEVAEGLARGVCTALGTGYGIGITGIAGPSGGTKDKPVGTVCIAVKTPRRIRSKLYQFWGDRNQIQDKAAKRALEMLWRQLKGL